MAETEALGMLPAAGSPALSNQLLAAHPATYLQYFALLHALQARSAREYCPQASPAVTKTDAWGVKHGEKCSPAHPALQCLFPSSPPLRNIDARYSQRYLS